MDLEVLLTIANISLVPVLRGSASTYVGSAGSVVPVYLTVTPLLPSSTPPPDSIMDMTMVLLAAAYMLVAAWVATMTTVPAPVNATSLPRRIARLLPLLMVYVIAPGDLDMIKPDNETAESPTFLMI